MLLAFTLLLVSCCDKKQNIPIENGNMRRSLECLRDALHVKDLRTGNCYLVTEAEYNLEPSFATIPCESIPEGMLYIFNNQKGGKKCLKSLEIRYFSFF